MKIQPWQRSGYKAGINVALVPLIGTALLTTMIAPASAQSVIVERGRVTYGVNQYPAAAPYIYQSPAPAAPFIYGSPIPTPIPVNPATGLPSSNTYYPYPGRRNVQDSTLINPILVNPRIRNSTLINPVIVDEPVYRAPVRYRRSRVIIGY